MSGSVESGDADCTGARDRKESKVCLWIAGSPGRVSLSSGAVSVSVAEAVELRHCGLQAEGAEELKVPSRVTHSPKPSNLSNKK